jgi:RNA polymerase sigma factor (sigma-70 family)
MDTQKLKKKADKLGVSTDVYLFLRQSNRKIRYFTWDLKLEQVIIDGERVTFVPSREVSLEQLVEDGEQLASDGKSVEDVVVESDAFLRLRRALDGLDEGEQQMIQEIFFSRDGDGKSEREAAQSLGIPQKTVNDRKLRALDKLKKFMETRK